MFEAHSHIIVDEMNLNHRLYATSKHLSWNGKPTGLIYSTLRSMIGFYRKGFTGEIIMCSDSKNTWKKDAGLGYKADRQKDVGGKFWEQVLATRHAMNHTQVAYASADKFEADDCAFSLLFSPDASIRAVPGKRILLYTQDSDWFYFLKREDVDIFNSKKILTKKIVEEKHTTVPVEKLVLFNAFRGCDHNNVKSVYDTWRSRDAAMELNEFSEIYGKQEHAENLDRIIENYYLVRPMLCDVVLRRNIEMGDAKKIVEIMEKYGIKSLIEFAHFLA